MGVFEDLRAEVLAVAQQAEAAGQDREAIDAALDRLTRGHKAIEQARRELADVATALVVRALVSGVDRTELVGRPYSATRVRQLALDAGLPSHKPGPRPTGKGRVAEVLAQIRESGGSDS